MKTTKDHVLVEVKIEPSSTIIMSEQSPNIGEVVATSSNSDITIGDTVYFGDKIEEFPAGICAEQDREGDLVKWYLMKEDNVKIIF